MNAVPLRVTIADDHPPTRAGLRLALEGHGFTVVAESGDAASAVREAIRARPDVCLLDVHMPGDGIEAALRIARQLPETTVVMITVSTDDADLVLALQAGAAGYVLKETDPTLLPGLIHAIVGGEAALPHALLERLLERLRAGEETEHRPVRRRDSDLTSREWEVLECLRQGLTTQEIADRLFLSSTTVRRHIGSVVRKLGVADRAAAVRAAESVHEI